METCIHEVMDVFYRPELGGLIVENVGVNGELVDCLKVDSSLLDMLLRLCGLLWM